MGRILDSGEVDLHDVPLYGATGDVLPGWARGFLLYIQVEHARYSFRALLFLASFLLFPTLKLN